MRNSDDVEYVDELGRKYVSRQSGELRIIVGPPEGLVDQMDLPEPFATRLHNVLYERRLLSYKDVLSNPKGLFGALQEALSVDAQKLTEAFYHTSKETLP